ncbi:flagellar hook capping FlgD N-terminal domain-containing protein [Castellaniella sp. S9]|uniref:flagellar hook capping FlgD N-terminal domain-containing protein n=1 Tax=Castellaniella sp. S9 TaxID=2993652 RepID=UPI0022B45E71|nr:flagellar hook capping FlgD N-terminal domain-containing protein [Castellaniella sp. S9]
MTTVSDTTATNAAALANAQTKSLMGDTQDRFLTLLVTQLQNQDPLNPMDNAQVTSQIAQLSTVNGIQQLNNTLLALSGQMDMSQSLQAASLIGKQVLIPGEKVSLGSDAADPTIKSATPFGIDLISGSSKTIVSIVDASGALVRKLDLGAMDAGVYALSWNGKDDNGALVADGAYSVQVSAVDADGNPVSAQALTSGTVGSVAYTSEGLKLDLGLAGKISLLDIRQIM